MHADAELLDYVDADPDVTLVAYSPLLKGVYAHGRRWLAGVSNIGHSGDAVRFASSPTRTVAGAVVGVAVALVTGSTPIGVVIVASWGRNGRRVRPTRTQSRSRRTPVEVSRDVVRW